MNPNKNGKKKKERRTYQAQGGGRMGAIKGGGSEAVSVAVSVGKSDGLRS